MDIEPGSIVRSRQGRDAGTFYVTLARLDERYLLLTDGRKRPVRRPKKKNIRHVEVVAPPPGPLKVWIEAGRRPSDGKILEVLLPFMEEVKEDGAQ
ncbi:MAG: KOW domain-containing RNA-binding protein [Clostridiales bacterium]|nr:KOW domain-containing RNA-binding protein [Clostridiales bacterium]